VLLGLELVVATDLSFARIFMACRGSGVRVSLAPFFEKVSRYLPFGRSVRTAFLVQNGQISFFVRQMPLTGWLGSSRNGTGVIEFYCSMSQTLLSKAIKVALK